MKVIVDTNVVVSAIIRDRLPEKIILSIVSHSDADFFVTGDKDFDGACQVMKTKIVSVSQFKVIVGQIKE